jgi:hypothetical protein
MWRTSHLWIIFRSVFPIFHIFSDLSIQGHQYSPGIHQAFSQAIQMGSIAGSPIAGPMNFRQRLSRFCGKIPAASIFHESISPKHSFSDALKECCDSDSLDFFSDQNVCIYIYIIDIMYTVYQIQWIYACKMNVRHIDDSRITYVHQHSYAHMHRDILLYYTIIIQY